MLTTAPEYSNIKNDERSSNGLERQAYDQLKKANQYPAGSTLRKLKEKHAKELFREVKRLRAKENKGCATSTISLASKQANL